MDASLRTVEDMGQVRIQLSRSYQGAMSSASGPSTSEIGGVS